MKLALTIGAGVLLSCGHAGPAPIPQLEPDSCARAEQRLRALDCYWEPGWPMWRTPEGTPFAETCERRMRQGTNFNPHCIARARSCSEVQARYRGELCD